MIKKETFLRLPKTDLHLHLDGSLRISTILDIAEKRKVTLPAYDEDKLKDYLCMKEGQQDLNEYLKAFDVTTKVMQYEEDINRISYELAEDCSKQNCWYIEVRFAPVLHTVKGLRYTEILEAVLDGLHRGERDFGIKAGVIVCGLRSLSPEISLSLAELAVAYKNRGVVAFDLAGPEENYPAKKHQASFQLMLNNNVNVTIHAGEGYGPESIHQAVHYCGAHRIGHGTRIKEDGDLLNYINDHRIPLEVCISSNIQTSVVKDYASHPVRFYYDYGLRVTINTDNLLVSNTTITDELYYCHKYLNFNFDEIKELVIFGFKSTFLPYKDKKKMLQEVVEELNKINEPEEDVDHTIKKEPTKETKEVLDKTI